MWLWCYKVLLEKQISVINIFRGAHVYIIIIKETKIHGIFFTVFCTVHQDIKYSKLHCSE